MIERFIIFVSEGPYQSLKPYSALRFARSLRSRGKEVKMIYYADGVHCLRKGVGQGSKTVGDYEALVMAAMGEGVKIAACPAPLSLYKYTESDLIPGVTVAENIADDLADESARLLWL
jgi:sulfur relay (sulfurtransferase) complex TusBCD TusD component (DsrE family)